MTAQNSLSITEKDLESYLDRAQAHIENARQRIALRRTGTSGSYVGSQSTTDDVSIQSLVDDIDQNDPLMSDAQLHTLRAIRRGIQIGFHVAQLYRESSGAAQFETAHGLTEIQKTELNEKMKTAAAVAVWTFARYVLWDMKTLAANNTFIGSVSAEYERVDLSRPATTIMSTVYQLGKHLEAVEKSDDRLVAIVYAFATDIQEKIASRVSGLKYVDAFTNVSYVLESTDFSLKAFDAHDFGMAKTVEVKEVYPNQVIGNTSAVAEVTSSVRKLFLYDPASQRNPINDFGGFQSVQLFSGDPGNGKTLILSVARTLGRDISEAIGTPYRDIVIPNMVSKMQGESTDLAQSIIQQLLDPTTVNLGIGDEWEAAMPDHGDDNISEGDKKVAVEWLKGLSGVGSQDRGNSLLLTATNYPEKVDKAFMSRVKSRHYIVGAETEDDYVRFIVLNLRKLNAQYPNIVNIENVPWDMDITAPKVPNAEEVFVSPEMSVQDIYLAAGKAFDPSDIRFFARFFYMMKERQKTFSLRDCANTIDGAKAHVSGFEIPEDWIGQPQHYVEQPLENKIGLLSELASKHVTDSGVDFAQMLREQAVYYAEEALRMAETRRQREVAAYTERGLVQHLAAKQLRKRLGT